MLVLRSLILTALFLGWALVALPAGAEQSGTFEIQSDLAPDVCLHALGPIAPGVRLGVGPCDGAPDSRFRRNDPGLLLGSFCLDGGDEGDASPLVARLCTGAAGQQWTFAADRALRTANGKCVEVHDSHTLAGPVLLTTCHGAPNQRWSQEPVGRRIQSLAQARMCLKVQGGIFFHAPVGVSRCDNDESSLFVFSGGRIEVGGMCLGANESGQVVLVPCDDPLVRTFTRAPDETLRSGDGRCLDPAHARFSVALWACDRSPGQRWRYDEPPPRQHGLPERPGVRR